MIDLRVASEVTARTQETVVRRLKKLYPNSQALQALNVNIYTTGGRVGFEQKSQGFRLSSEDETDVVMVMPSGMAVARLAPYPGWEVVREGAQASLGNLAQVNTAYRSSKNRGSDNQQD